VFHILTQHQQLGNASPFGLHTALFIPGIKALGSSRRVAYWLPKAERGEIIGGYAQTELGHGTFLRGLEATATYDRTTEEFVLNSPTTTSAKYWPGGLGYSTTHAITLAQLIVDEENHGPHQFIVQYQSLEDFTPLPGIELGDIGFKMFYNRTDNG
jgi:acyl-CoA oxidase